MFHQVPEGKTVKNRVHIDLQAAGLDRSRPADNNNRWISMRDPESNEFDLVARG